MNIEITPIHNLMAHSFLIQYGRKAILIDSGPREEAKGIEKVLKKKGVAPGDIALIILTHTHYDHSSGAAALSRTTDTPILLHESEADFLKQGWAPTPQGTSSLFRFIISHVSSDSGHFSPVEAEITIKGHYSLEQYGFPGIVLHTPGHTRGSLCVIMEDGYCFCGDTFFHFLPGKIFPPVANDPVKLLQSWGRLAGKEIKKVFPAHGTPFKANLIAPRLEKLRRKLAID